MSRRRLPRRFPLLVWIIAAAAPAAWAQMPSGPDTVARTTIGAPASQACTQYTATGNFTDAALETCNRALESRLGRADRIAALINRGITHMRRREGEAAVADFDAVIAIEPRNAEAHLNRGAALVGMHQPGPAVAAITEALSLGVHEPYKAYYNRGAAREALGDVRGAYEDYSTALEIHPNWAPAEAELARFVRTRQEALAAMLNGANAVPPQPQPH